MSRRLLWIALLAALFPAQRAHAFATFRIVAHGSGFSDGSPVAPVGGNPGTTLGEQREIALEHALSLWGRKLESAVPIVVDVQFEPMGCGEAATVLAGAAPSDAFQGLSDNGANPNLFYPSALADSLAQRDLAPGRPDVNMYINSQVDEDCAAPFYYGLDARPEGRNDFVEVILHELAHGLGIRSAIDLDSGELFMGTAPDPFTVHIRDLDLDQSWDRLNPAQRRRSASNVQRLVFDGMHASEAVPRLAEEGPPRLSFTPNVPAYSGLVGDSYLGFAEGALSGRVVAADECRLVAPTSDARWIALFSACGPANALRAAQDAKAAAVLLVVDSIFESPPVPFDHSDRLPEPKIPVATVTASDAIAIRAAALRGPLEAALSSAADGWLGADGAHRPLLFATEPIQRGSSVSHLDWSMRPNELMEAFASEEPAHDLTLTLAMLRDLGWLARCGDGRLDSGEDCDDGPRNSDTAADACRSDCRRARCGDGVRDAQERCDEGDGNRDDLANACRSDCEPAGCGDGVLDEGEQCDRGSDNSDQGSGACRTSCRLPSCGDGVVDGPEQCDQGDANSNTVPAACRSDCRLARCGDGVVDPGESCDPARDGPEDDCRADCTRRHCGDGVLDPGEACDGTADCLAVCRLVPMPSPPSAMPAPRSLADKVARKHADAHAPRGSGCGCQVPSARSGKTSWFGLMLLLGCVLWRKLALSSKA